MPWSFIASAGPAAEPADDLREGIQLGGLATYVDPHARCRDEANAAQARDGPRLEAVHGFRKPPVAFGLHGPHEFLRSGRSRGTEVADRAVEVREDPAHLFLQGREGRATKGLDGILLAGRQGLAGRPIGRFEAGVPCLRPRSQRGVRVLEGDLPSGSTFEGHGNRMEGLALLIGKQGDTEREQREADLGRFLDGRSRHARALECGTRPRGVLRQESPAVPSPPPHGETEDPLEAVAPGSHELRTELAGPFRVEGEARVRGEI